MDGMDDLAASVDFLRRARERWFGGSTEAHVATRARAVERSRRHDATITSTSSSSS